MSVPVTLEALDLAALLCSRMCHDLISPTGAIVNGLEVFEDSDDEDTRSFALELIRKSARTASARLQFCRVAFGAAGSSTAQIDLGDAETLARGFVEAEKVKVAWNLPRAAVPKSRVRLLMNMILVAAQAIPRGGVLTVEGDGAAETMTFRIAARGLNARIFDQVPALLQGRPESGTVDAQGIQPYYTGLLARTIGLEVTIAADGDGGVVVAARPPVAVPAPRPLRRRVDWLREPPPSPLSGQSLTATSLSAPSLNATPLSATSLNAASLNAASLSAASLSPLSGTSLSTQPLNGRHVVGSGRLAPQAVKPPGGVEPDRPFPGRGDTQPRSHRHSSR